MDDNVSHDSSHSSKCLCSYCSGSIAKGMKALNERDVSECTRLAQMYKQGQNEDLDELSAHLDALNPVQCFDVLDQLCSGCSPTKDNGPLDDLILKFVERFRNNGGFFLALRQPQERRQHLLQRLADCILLHSGNARRANLTSNELNP